MAVIGINREAVLQQGTSCAQTGADVGAAAPILARGQLPNTMLASRASIATNQDIWGSTFSKLAETLISVGNKLQTTANTVGNTDIDAAEQYKPVGVDPKSKYDEYE